jgi:hypothetical protein
VCEIFERGERPRLRDPVYIERLACFLQDLDQLTPAMP